MVPDKLLAYLGEQKSKGYPDQMIKGQFLQRGWPESTLNEAYAQINGVQSSSKSDESALSSIIAASPPTPPSTTTNVPLAPAPTAPTPDTLPELPKKWVTGLMVLLFLMSGEYSAHGTRFVYLTIILQAELSKAGINTLFIANYPMVAIAVLASLGVGWYYFYLALRSRTFSEKTWKLSAISLISIPFVYYPLLNLLVMPLLSDVAAMNKTAVSLLLPGTDILLSLAIGFVLWKTKGLHNQPDNPLSKKLRFWLIAVITLSILSLIGSGLIIGKYSSNGELDYVLVSSQIDHKLYNLPTLPEDMAFITKYEIKTETDGAQVVRIGLGTQISQASEGNNVSIVVTQQELPPGYDVLSTFADYMAPPETVILPIAVNQNGYFGKKQLSTEFLGNLAFATPDGVLINILGPNVELPLLLDVASRLQ